MFVQISTADRTHARTGPDICSALRAAVDLHSIPREWELTGVWFTVLVVTFLWGKRHYTFSTLALLPYLKTLTAQPGTSSCPRPRRTRSADGGHSGPLSPTMAFAEVGLYWDFENVGLGAGFSMADLAALLARVRGYGRLHESRLYYDSCKASSEGFLSKHRELVERLGVTLVDCLVWALGRLRLQPACVVLMSSDGDFAHMLSRLEQNGVRTIVIGRSAVLRTVCHTALTLREACSGADAKGGGKEGGGTEGGVAGDATAAVPAASRTSRARLQNEHRREQSRDHAQPQAQAHEKACAQARAPAATSAGTTDAAEAKTQRRWRSGRKRRRGQRQ